MYQPGSDALTGCPDNAPDDDGEELMEPVDGFRADCPDNAPDDDGEEFVDPVDGFTASALADFHRERLRRGFLLGNCGSR